MGADASALALGNEVSFEFDGMLAFLFMHPVQEAVVIDVEILQLMQPRTEPANLERMLLLHQLNGITRFTHGAQALVSVDNMLMITQSLPLTGLTGQGLVDWMGQLLDTASDLNSTWNDLQSLIAQAGRQAMASSTETPPLTMSVNFV